MSLEAALVWIALAAAWTFIALAVVGAFLEKDDDPPTLG